MGDLINIKGSREGLRMHLAESAEWPAILAELHEQLGEGGDFFAGARLVIDVGDRALSEAQLAETLEVMQTYGLQPDSLASTTRESRNAARALGVTARPSAQRKTQAAPSSEGEATLISRTVRSGQVIRHQAHVTLIGDINPGAEIIAGGSVVVWGRLRGLVHAGALGNRNAVVCALELRPTQLRIADVIVRTPDDQAETLPEIARVEHNEIIVEAWRIHKRLKADS